MNRDAVIATLIGFAVGLVVIGVILVTPNLTKFLPRLPKITFSIKLFTPKLNPKVSPTPSPGPTTLTIQAPLAEAVTNTDNLSVSGTAPEGALVVVGGPQGETVTQVKDGKYTATISLVEGKNDLVVNSFASGKQLTQTVTVYYTPEDF